MSYKHLPPLCKYLPSPDYIVDTKNMSIDETKAFIDNFCFNVMDDAISNNEKKLLFLTYNKALEKAINEIQAHCKSIASNDEDSILIEKCNSTISNFKTIMEHFKQILMNDSAQVIEPIIKLDVPDNNIEEIQELKAEEEKEEELLYNYAILIDNGFVPLSVKSEEELLKIINTLDNPSSVKAYRLMLEDIPLKKIYTIDKKEVN